MITKSRSYGVGIFLCIIMISSPIALTAGINDNNRMNIYDKSMTSDLTKSEQHSIFEENAINEIDTSSDFPDLLTHEFEQNNGRNNQIVKWDRFPQQTHLDIPAQSYVKITGDDMIEYIIQFHDDLEELSLDFLSRYGIDLVDFDKSSNIAVVNVPLEITSTIEKNVRFNTEEIRTFEPNFYIKADFIPDDANWTIQWGPQVMGMTDAWDIETGSESIIVAVIDTGIDYTHPDLRGNYLDIGWDHVNDDSDPMDDHNHGTHVAGTIAASIDNSLGIAGIANVSIMAEKFLASDGYGSSLDAAASIRHAVDMGADILSNSWGSYGASTIVQDAINYALRHGVMVIAAAGNDAISSPHYPAAYDGVIGVSATDINDNLAAFSNYGDYIDISAPGVDIYSTLVGGQYGNFSGTSMATPHVSGLAALIMSQYPDYTSDQIENLMYSTAMDFGKPGWDKKFGWGRIQANASIDGLVQYDLAVSSSIPSRNALDEEIPLQYSVANFGMLEQENISVAIMVNNSLVATHEIETISPFEIISFTDYWSDSTIGIYNFTVFVDVSGETRLTNNQATTWMQIKDVDNYSIYDPIVGWYDAKSNGIEIGLDTTNLYTQLDLPFNFSFYGFEYDTINVGLTGWLSFTEMNAFNPYNEMFPTDNYHDIIAPLWSDIYGINSIYMWNTSDYFVLEYDNYLNFDDNPIGSFEVVLFKDGQILFLYDNVRNLNSYTIGVNWGYQSGYSTVFEDNIESYLEYGMIFRDQPLDNDLSVQLHTENAASVGETTLIEYSVTNLGSSTANNVGIDLYINNSLIAGASEIITSLESFDTYDLEYLWTPEDAGEVNITVDLVYPSDPFPLNDNLTRSVDVFQVGSEIGASKIGIITSHGEESLSNLNTFYTTNEYTVETIATALTPQILSEYSLVLVGESGYSWSVSDLQAIDDYLKLGGSVALIGDSIYSEWDWTSAYGIEFSSLSGTSITTTNINPHPLTDAVNTMYFGYAIGQVVIGANGKSIVDDDTGAYSMVGVSTEYKIVMVTEDLESYITSEDNSQFLLNLADWAILQTHELRVDLSPKIEVFKPGYTKVMNFQLINDGTYNESDIVFDIFLNGTKLGGSTTVSQLISGERFYVNYTWSPTEIGTYNFTLNASTVTNETIIDNNRLVHLVEVTDVPLIGIIRDNSGEPLTEIGNLYESRGYYVKSINNLLETDMRVFDLLLAGETSSWSDDQIELIDTYLTNDGKMAIMADSGISSYQWLHKYGLELISSYGLDTRTQNIPVHPLFNDVEVIDVIDPRSYISYSTGYSLLESEEISGYSKSYIGVSSFHKLIVMAYDAELYVYNGDNANIFLNILNWEYPTTDIGVAVEIPRKIVKGGENNITINVYNPGTQTLTGFDLQFSLNDEPVISEVYDDITLSSGDVYSVNFTTYFDTFGQFSVDASVTTNTTEDIMINNDFSSMIVLEPLVLKNNPDMTTVNQNRIIVEYITLSPSDIIGLIVQVNSDFNYTLYSPISPGISVPILRNGINYISIQFDFGEIVQVIQFKVNGVDIEPVVPVTEGSYLEYRYDFSLLIGENMTLFYNFTKQITPYSFNVTSILIDNNNSSDIEKDWFEINILTGEILQGEDFFGGTLSFFFTGLTIKDIPIDSQIGTIIPLYEWSEFGFVSRFNSEDSTFVVIEDELIEYHVLPYNGIIKQLGFPLFGLSVDLIDSNLLVNYTTPSIDNHQDMTMVNGSINNNLIWKVESSYPIGYGIEINGIKQYQDMWLNTSTITFNVDHLSIGTYALKITVVNKAGMKVIDFVGVNVIEDTYSPVIIADTSTTIELSDNMTLQWEIDEDNEFNYTILRNSRIALVGTHQGSTIKLGLNGMRVGDYNFTLIVTDILGYRSQHTMEVFIVDTTAPSILSGPESIVASDTLDKIPINWTVFDYAPSYYEVLVGGSVDSYSEWTNSKPIEVSLDNPGIGNTTITLKVYDESGNMQSTTVELSITGEDNFNLIIAAGITGLVALVVGGVLFVRRRTG